MGPMGHGTHAAGIIGATTYTVAKGTPRAARHVRFRPYNLAGLSLTPGTRLGPYDIIAAIGAGGMGEVYRGVDTRLGREVAIKVLPASAAGSPDAQARFEREARAIAALNHPNICTLFDVGTADGHTYLVMELLSGETLHQLLARGALPIPAVVEHGAVLTDAIESAHARHIVHRDLKPANVFVTSSGVMKVLDFGLAKAGGTADDATRLLDAALTDPGTAIGTLSYMSPEQLRADPVDARTHLFSFGLILYEMATGRRAFSGKTSAEVSAAILHEEPPRPSTLRPDLPPRLEDIILKALEKDRDLRYQSAADMRADLKRLKRQSDPAASVAAASTSVALPAPPATVVGPAPSSSDAALAVGLARRHPVLVAVAVIAVIGAAAAAWWSRGRGPSAPAAPLLSAANLTLQELTLDGEATQPTISPDGKFIAYVRDDGARTSVVVKQLGSNSDVVILPPSEDRAYWAPSVTPDGSYVDVLVMRPSPRGPASTAIVRVPFLGGAEQTVIEDAASGLGWSPDGRKVALVRYDSGTQTSTLVVADADFRNPRGIYSVHQPQFLRNIRNSSRPSARPAWSPDGKWIAVAGSNSVATPPNDGDSIIELDAATGAVRQIRQIDHSLNELSYLDDDRLIAAVSSDGSDGWWRLYPRVGDAVALTSDLAAIHGAQLTADRGRGVAERTAERSSIWIVNLASGAVKQMVAESGSRPDWGALDGGGNLWYSQQVPGGQAVFRLAKNAGAGQLVARNLRAPMPSPDGQFAIGWSDAGFVRIDLDGRTTPFLEDPTSFPDGFTPDGSAFLFVSNKAGHQQPWIAPLDGSGARRLATTYLSGGLYSLSPDGRQVIFVDSDGKSQICDFPRFDHCRDAGGVRAGPLSVNSHIAYGVSARDEMNIVAQLVEGGAPTPVTHFSDKLVGRLRLSADFKTLVFTRTVRESKSC